MRNLAALRNSELLQYEFALGTGRTVANLLSRTKDLHGNTDVFNAMASTESSSSPVKWLGEDEFLEASITGLKTSPSCPSRSRSRIRPFGWAERAGRPCAAPPGLPTPGTPMGPIRYSPCRGQNIWRREWRGCPAMPSRPGDTLRRSKWFYGPINSS